MLQSLRVFSFTAAENAPAIPSTSAVTNTVEGIALRTGGEDTHIADATSASTIRDQTTLLPNESEAFALEPIDVTSLGKSSNAS